MTDRPPPVDPEYLVEEEDPDTLHGHARWLLQHLREIRRGEKADGFPIATIKTAACWLVDAYADAGVPPCPELALLIRELMKSSPDARYPSPVQDENLAAYWEALAFEAQHPEASVYAIAKHVRMKPGFPNIGTRKRRNQDQDPNPDAEQKAAESIVNGWRKLSHYKENVLFQRDADALFRRWRAADRVKS